MYVVVSIYILNFQTLVIYNKAYFQPLNSFDMTPLMIQISDYLLDIYMSPSILPMRTPEFVDDYATLLFNSSL